METHEKYIESLSTEDKQLLKEYTGYSVRWVAVTSYIREPSPFTYKKISNMDVQSYVERVNKIITNAPKEDTSITVYRGTGEKEIPIDNGLFVFKGFSGCSLSKEIAAGFSEECCLYELELPPNTPFLYVESISKVKEEKEILLPSNSMFEFVSKTKTTINGKEYTITKGKYKGFQSYKDMDFSKRFVIDKLTNSFIEGRMNVIKNQKQGVLRLLCKNKSAEECERMKKQSEQEIENERKKLLKEFGIGGRRKTWRMPRKMSKKYCKKTPCKRMGFTQRASCRPYKNCY